MAFGTVLASYRGMSGQLKANQLIANSQPMVARSSRRDYRGLLQVLLIRRYGHRGIAAAFDKKTPPLTGGVFASPSLVLVFAGEPDYLPQLPGDRVCASFYASLNALLIRSRWRFTLKEMYRSSCF